MTRWRLFIGLGLVVMLLLGYLAVWYAVPREVRAFNRIEPGMTLTEVESIIGMPPGDYRTEGDDFRVSVGVKAWQWDNNDIYVGFDANGKVFDKAMYPPSQSFFDRVLEILGF